MIIEISMVTEEGVPFQGEEAASILELLPSDFAEAEGAIAYDLWAWKQPGQLFVKGKVGVPLRAVCARCGAFFSTNATDSGFLRDYLYNDGQKSVDITADLREAVLLQLPAYSLCRPDCRGLCPRCGHRLNDGPCGCRPPEESTPWSALDRLGL